MATTSSQIFIPTFSTANPIRSRRFTPLSPITVSPNPSQTSILGHSFHLQESRKYRFEFRNSALSEASGSTSVLPENLATVLKGIEVVDLSGKQIPILDLWRERKSVVGFARHFGCVFCRKRADFLASKKDTMDKAGVACVIIGPGSVDQAKAFSEQTKFKGEVYADPSHASFDALKFVSGVTTTFTPSAGLKIAQLYMEGYRQDWGLSFQKDTVTRGGWQQGGLLVAGPGESNILYLHKDKEAGDDPDIEEVMKVCCS